MTRSIYQFDGADTDAAGAAKAPHVAGQAGEASRIGVIRNPRSRHNLERPSSATPESGIMLALPEGREAVAPALAGLAEKGLDFLVIDGGDGTVRDVLTLGNQVFGDDWPVLAVLPKGKTNALTLDLGLPTEWRLPNALDAWRSGRRVVRRPLKVTPLGQGDAPPITGFILGAGAFTTGIRKAQDAHSLGLFNNFAVALTAASGIFQMLFGTNANPWRKGVPIRFFLGPDLVEAPRSEHGDAGWRNFALATTLENMPMDLRIFGPPRLGLKLAVLDLPLRRVMLASPLVMAGRLPEWIGRVGYKVHDIDSFEFETGEPFIIDGEAFPPGRYRAEHGPPLTFVAP